MSDYVNFIQAMRADTARSAKEAVLVQYKDNIEILKAINYCYNYKKIFGIKQLPNIEFGAHKTNTAKVFELFDDLVERKYTGNAAKDKIFEIITTYCNEDDWNEFFKYVLLKDMNAGFTEGTFNKVISQCHPTLTIPEFDCQLAKDGYDHTKKVFDQDISIEAKLDGVRVLIQVEKNNHQYFSRNGKSLSNFSSQFDFTLNELNYDAFSPYTDEPTKIILDGEVMSKNFHQLMTQVRRKSDVDVSDSYLCLFDWLPVGDFNRGEFKLSYKQRRNVLELFFLDNKVQLADKFTLPDMQITNVSNLEQIKTIIKSYTDRGYEGIMVKRLDAPYKCTRSDAWLKFKPKETLDLTIVGYVEGTKKNQGRLGAILVEGKSEIKIHESVEDTIEVIIRTAVGSGFSDGQREEIWANRDSLLGKLIEVEYDMISKNKKTYDYSLRFPIYKGFRHDKS